LGSGGVTALGVPASRFKNKVLRRELLKRTEKGEFA
jgi:hypothetical protein